MKVSWNWLGEFVDLAGLEPAQVASRLSLSGLEVEAVHTLGAELDGVVVGHVLECGRVPESDHLNLCTVDSGAEILQIVCGAPNVRVGLKVALATVGTSLPGGLKIKKSKIRGIESSGMLCSASELGLDSDASGLIELPADTRVGVAFADAMGMRDTVLEIGVTPNRSDALGIRGVAREVAALYERNLHDPVAPPAAIATKTAAESVKVSIAEPAACNRYCATVVRNVRIGPSPRWMQQRLVAVGQRPINTIVDVTNYILFEQGQPIHAFDLDKLRGHQLRVRRASSGEVLASLDGKDRKLEAADLVICDSEGPVAIAGVMGGANSEIDEKSVNVVIECAVFSPSSVRKTARRLGMHTESSHRFERGTDRDRLVAVIRRAAQLMASVSSEAGAMPEVSPDVIDVEPAPVARIQIRMPGTMPAKILGLEIAGSEIESILVRLGLDVTVDGSDFVVGIPAFRPDLVRPIDLVEEVGRVVGFDRIPVAPLRGELGLEHTRRADSPVEQPRQPVLSGARLDLLSKLRSALVQEGFCEAVNWAMTSPASLDKFYPGQDRLRLKNPLGEETSVLRTTLLPALMQNLEGNLARGANSAALFEIANVFPAGAVAIENTEPQHLAGILTGDYSDFWRADRPQKVDAFDAIGLVQSVFAAIGYPLELSIATEVPIWAHPGVISEAKFGGQSVGWIGQVHPQLAAEFACEEPVYAYEFSLDSLLAHDRVPTRYRGIPRTQESTRDVALLIDRAIAFERVQRVLASTSTKFLESVRLFDVYEGDKLPPGKKSIALRITYRDPAGTLTDAQIEKSHARLVKGLVDGLDAIQR